MSDVVARTPTMPEVLRAAVQYYVRDLHTALPGRVVDYDAEAQTVDVQPMINRLDLTADGEDLLEELPVIPQVPVGFNRTTDWFITFPVQVGDRVLLTFCERSIDTYLESTNDNPVDPEDFRLHDLSDAVAGLSLYPDRKAIVDIDKNRLTLGKDKGGAKIHIDGDNVEITWQSGVTVKFDGKDANATMVLGNGAVSATIYEAMQSFWDSTFKNYMDNFVAKHVHVSPESGAPTGPAVLSVVPPIPFPNGPSFPTNAQSTKVTMPNG